MGAFVESHAVIGFKVPRELAIERVTVPAFEHSYPREYQYDPMSKRELWRDANEPIAPFSRHPEGGYQLDGFRVFESGPHSSPGDYIYIAAVSASCSEFDQRTGEPNGLALTPELAARTQELQRIVAGHAELSEAAVFGFWAILEFHY
jgi:hypothetical protein